MRNIIDTENLSEALKIIETCIISQKDIYMYDSPNVEILSLPESEEIDLVSYLENSKIKFHFQTSGTTGIPKKIVQPIIKLLKGVRSNTELENAVWGYCYSCRHISGILMMLQAIMTNRPLIDLRNRARKEVESLILENSITHISAPATFYRLTFPLSSNCPSVLKATNGGEPLDKSLIDKIKKSLPNVELRNIYASTEFGSLLISKNDKFVIPDKLKNLIRIENSELIIHQSLVSDSATIVDEWYHTKDLIEWIDEKYFYIKGRVSEDVKVLGHLVSLRKIEQKVYNIKGIKQVRINAKKHDVFGNLLIAHIVMEEGHIFNKKDLKTQMKNELRDYEVPSKIKEVDFIELTSSGKVSRV